MVLTLCPNCRLPVRRSMAPCPQCATSSRLMTALRVPAAALAVAATTMAAVLVRRVA